MLAGHRKNRRRLSAAGMFILIMLGTLVLLMLLRTVHTVAQDGLPTPEGQLGGAVSLATEPSAPEPPPAPEQQTPTPVARLDIPDPDLCEVDPRTVEGMLALVEMEEPPSSTPEERNIAASEGGATPAAPTVATESANTTVAEVISDRPATAAIVGQIQRTVREIVACGNAGEMLSVWAYFSDNFVRSSAALQPALFNSTILTARARAQGPRTDAMPRVTTVRLLSDDRVSAVVTIPTASPFATVANKTGTVTVLFIQERDSWLVDEIRRMMGLAAERHARFTSRLIAFGQ